MPEKEASWQDVATLHDVPDAVYADARFANVGSTIIVSREDVIGVETVKKSLLYIASLFEDILNRRMPNGTYGGVIGGGALPLFDYND